VTSPPRVNLANLPEAVRQRVEREWSREFQRSSRFRPLAVVLIVLLGGPFLTFKFFEHNSVDLSPTVAVAAAATMVAGCVALYLGHDIPRRRFYANRVAQLGYCGNCGGAAVGPTPGRCPACGTIIPVPK
jgi:hypothetical protein